MYTTGIEINLASSFQHKLCQTMQGLKSRTWITTLNLRNLGIRIFEQLVVSWECYCGERQNNLNLEGGACQHLQLQQVTKTKISELRGTL